MNFFKMHVENFEKNLFRMLLMASIPFWFFGVIRGGLTDRPIVITIMDGVAFLFSIAMYMALERKTNVTALINIYCMTWIIGFIYYWKYMGGLHGPFSYSYFTIFILFVGLLQGQMRYVLSLLFCAIIAVLALDSSSETLLSIEPFETTWRLSFNYLLNSVLIAVLLIYIKLNFDKERKEILQHNEELFELNEEVRQKQEYLIEQEFDIKLVQSNLEQLVRDSTRELEEKNKELEDHAYKNAHIIRAPLSNVLGLINILKEKKNKELLDPTLLENIEKEAKDLDKVVNKINTILE